MFLNLERTSFLSWGNLCVSVCVFFYICICQLNYFLLGNVCWCVGAGAWRGKREASQNKNKGRLNSLINPVSPFKYMQWNHFLFNFSFLLFRPVVNCRKVKCRTLVYFFGKQWKEHLVFSTYADWIEMIYLIVTYWIKKPTWKISF